MADLGLVKNSKTSFLARHLKRYVPLADTFYNRFPNRSLDLFINPVSQSN
jgi:hypothetical protein